MSFPNRAGKPCVVCDFPAIVDGKYCARHDSAMRKRMIDAGYLTRPAPEGAPRRPWMKENRTDTRSGAN